MDNLMKYFLIGVFLIAGLVALTSCVGPDIENLFEDLELYEEEEYERIACNDPLVVTRAKLPEGYFPNEIITGSNQVWKCGSGETWQFFSNGTFRGTGMDPDIYRNQTEFCNRCGCATRPPGFAGRWTIEYPGYRTILFVSHDILPGYVGFDEVDLSYDRLAWIGIDTCFREDR